MPKKTAVKCPPDAPKDRIAFRDSGIHGMGCFAVCTIRKGMPIIEYVGERITKAEGALRCDANNRFIFVLDDETDVDGDVSWNPARHINHGCAPNAEAEIFGDQIWIMAIRNIAEGEEITFNYGYDLEDHKSHPCRCGAESCVGYMVAMEFFPKLTRKDRVPAAKTPKDSSRRRGALAATLAV